MPNDTRSGLKISGNRSFMEGLIFPRARTSTLLKECEIILIENGNKWPPTSKEELWNVLQEAWRSITLNQWFPTGGSPDSDWEKRKVRKMTML